MTSDSPSEAVAVNPTELLWSIKKAFGLPIIFLPRLDAIEVKGSMRLTQTTPFCYHLVLRSPVGVVNKNVTIVYARLVLRHQGSLHVTWCYV
jgi:hypothetical protein